MLRDAVEKSLENNYQKLTMATVKTNKLGACKKP
jgi:hypothetical protein